MSKTRDIAGGLEVVCLPSGHGWYVAHAASGLEVHGGGWLRQKRFAVEARADLLATGIDWTLSVKELSGQLGKAWPVVALWRKRAGQDSIDLVTGEHYSWSTHHGQVIPSEAHARRIAEALAAFAWS